MVDIPVLTTSDLQFLRELKRDYERTNRGRQTLERNRSPESGKSTYLVEVPEGEVISAKTSSIVDHLTCYVVRLNRENDTLQRTGQTLEVYNGGTSDIQAGYTQVIKDAFGTWWVGEGGSNVQIVRFTIIAGGFLTDFPSGIRSASAEVDARFCNTPILDLEEGTGTGSSSIRVYDMLGCWFNDTAGDVSGSGTAEETLVGKQGYAANMKPEDVTGTGDLALCAWEIISMCDNANCFIPGVDPDNVSIATPEYILGIDLEGCLIKVPVTDCEPVTGAGS